MRKILVIHGPNLGLLGQREPEIYGTETLDGINQTLQSMVVDKTLVLECFQSDHEGEIVQKIGSSDAQVLIINPAAYSHTSVAIADAIAARKIDAVEVHLSNIYAREKFRHKSLIAPYVRGQISGFGKDSYVLALQMALKWSE